MLTRIRDYLQQRGAASLADIARHLEAEPDAVRPMLELWVAKGRIRRLPSISCAAACRRCDGTEVELYAWGSATAGPPLQTGCRRN